MKLIKKKYLWAVMYATLLTAFTIYVLMDTFVITRVYTTLPTETSSESQVTQQESEASVSSSADEASQSSAREDTQSTDEAESGGTFTQSAVVTENSYSDQNISITITAYREYDTTIYVADVYVTDASYLKTAFANNAYGRNVTEKTSEIAQANGAILAINGDYYGSQSEGYVLRNGVLYRETDSDDQEDLVIWADGSFQIITEGEVSASQLVDNGAAQVLSFGPALVTEGEISVSQSEEVGKAKASNPRTAIGIVDDLHYLFVVSDGRTDESEGLTLYQLAEFMQSLGADTAYNLDGGGSSTMYFNGTVINNPTTNGNSIKERSVSDIVYIG